MFILHTDLDDTLIYSKRKEISVPKTCVEYYNGEPLSYMLNTSIEKLSRVLNIQDILVVPTTARSKEQFQRVNLPDFEYAIVSNGGILLKDGKVDKDWYDYSLSLAEKCNDLFKEFLGVLKHDSNICGNITFNENLFLRTRSIKPGETIELLKSHAGGTDYVSIYNLGNKVYVFPKDINKNSAILRFKELFKADFTVLADDSLHNYSSCVDLFLTTDKQTLHHEFSNISIVDDYLSENMLDFVLERC